MDSFGSSALFPAIPALEQGLNIAPNEITWEFSGKPSSPMIRLPTCSWRDDARLVALGGIPKKPWAAKRASSGN